MSQLEHANNEQRDVYFGDALDIGAGPVGHPIFLTVHNPLFNYYCGYFDYPNDIDRMEEYVRQVVLRRLPSDQPTLLELAVHTRHRPHDHRTLRPAQSLLLPGGALRLC